MTDTSVNFSSGAEDAPSAARPNKNDKGRLSMRLESCIRELRWDGRGLPTKQNMDLVDDDDDFQRLDLVTIATWVRHTPASELTAEPFRSILLRGAAALHLETHKNPEPTLSNLHAALTRQHHSARLDQLVEASDCEHLLAELNGLQEALALPVSTRLESIFGNNNNFQEIKASLLINVDDDDVESKCLILDRLRDNAAQMIFDASLPETFAARLTILIKKSKLTDLQIAQRSGTNVRRIRRLKNGAEPRLEMKQFIHKLEAVLGAKPNSLWSFVFVKPLRIRTDNVYTREVRRMLKVVGCHLDFLPENWTELSDKEKRDAIDWIKDEIVLGTAYRRMTRALYGRLDPLSAEMKAEFDKIEKFKTETVPSIRSFPREKKVAFGPYMITYGGRWSPGSARTVRSYIQKTLTVVNALCTDATNAWQEQSGCGFLINHKLQHRVTKQIAHERYLQLKRANAFAKLNFREPADQLVYADADTNQLERLMGLFCPNTGYLFHVPPKLAVIPGLIDQDWVDRAEMDWPATVNDEREQLRQLITDIRKVATQIRDPWLPIMPILELDEPLTPVLQAIDLMASDRPSFYGSPMVMGRHDRAFFVLNLLAHSRLRRANYGKLTWRPDNTGNLRWDIGLRSWKLVIPQDDLKNRGSRALPKGGGDLILILEKEDPQLYTGIARWLGHVDPATGLVDEKGSSRRLLHGDDCGDFLFPGENLDAGLCEYSLSSIVYRFSARYLTGRPWSDVGIQGLKPFGPHAFRDIVATHIIKNTGSLEQAAAALGDAPETLEEHYAFWTSVEKSKLTNKTIRQTTQRLKKSHCGSGVASCDRTQSVAATSPENNEMTRLRQLEEEHTMLTERVAELSRDKAMLQEVLAKMPQDALAKTSETSS